MTDLLIRGGTVVTMDAERRVLADGAVAVAGNSIVAVGHHADLTAHHRDARVIDAGGMIVTPGLVNAHVHLTGASLFPGAEPAESPLADHFPRWVLPPHEHGDADAERAAARLVGLGMLRHGTTAFVEAGVVLHPEAVLDGLESLGLRGALGVWAADRWPVPGAGLLGTDAVLGRMRAALGLAAPNGRLAVWPNVVGHDGCSDGLLVAAAALARDRGTPWTLHLAATADDRDWFRATHGRDPFPHLAALGVLDERCVPAHAIDLTDADAEALAASGATVAFCPGAALRLCTGVTRTGRHPELPRVALGTDTQNASNHLDVLRAAGLACDLYGELRGDRTALTAERALEWLTLGGAAALGMADRIGSLEPGKLADIVVFDPGQPVWHVANALVHGAPRAVHVIVDGRHVLSGGRVPGQERILADAESAAERVGARCGLPRHTGSVPA